jgi:dual specificity protein kinase YAK1
MTPTREYPQQPGQVQPPAGFKYDQYQPTMTSHSAQSSAASPITTPQVRDGNGDVPMQDVHDPYGAMKYPMRPHHQSHLSGGRPPNLHSPSEPSTAAQRYSPMEVLSPTSPYGSKSTSNQGQFSTSHSQRQSPTRADYIPTSPYYGRQGSQQLPPIGPYVNSQDSYQSAAVAALDGSFANDPKSPRRPALTHVPAEKKPVPQFRKIETPTELRPRINSQPPFRRANPEGGFISV